MSSHNLINVSDEVMRCTNCDKFTTSERKLSKSPCRPPDARHTPTDERNL